MMEKLTFKSGIFEFNLSCLGSAVMGYVQLQMFS